MIHQGRLTVLKFGTGRFHGKLVPKRTIEAASIEAAWRVGGAAAAKEQTLQLLEPGEIAECPACSINSTSAWSCTVCDRKGYVVR